MPTHWSRKGYHNAAWGPPSTGWIEKTFRTLYEKCPDAKDIETTIVLNHHGGPLQYEDALRRFCHSHGFNFRMDPSAGFRGVRLNMCDWFKKDYLFLVEHDWEWKVDVSLVDIISTFEWNGQVNYVRFNKRDNMPKQVLTATKRVGGDLYLTPDRSIEIDLLHTPQYSNNPHVERMSKYREWCEIVKNNPVFAGKNGGAGGFEHPLQEASLDDLEEMGVEARNKKWGTYVYGTMGMSAAVKHFGI